MQSRPFAPAVLAELVAAHRPAFTLLARLERSLNERFHEVEKPVRALILAALTGEPLLFVGPPGTGKSRLIRALCRNLGLAERGPSPAATAAGAPRQRSYFEYLLTPFTEPGELFGFYDIGQLREGRLERLDDGMLQHSEVVFLDEVFNGSSAILNSILAILNERQFHDRGRVTAVKAELILAASNQVPEAAELRAVYDRFTLRCPIGNLTPVEAGRLSGLLERGWRETFAEPPPLAGMEALLGQLATFRADVRARATLGTLIPVGDPRFFQDLAGQVELARRQHLSAMSNRRLVKLVYVMLVHRLYRAVASPELVEAEIGFWAEEFELLRDYFLDRDEPRVAQKLERLRHHGPHAASDVERSAPPAPAGTER